MYKYEILQHKMDLGIQRLAIAQMLTDLEGGLADLVKALAHGDISAKIDGVPEGAAIRVACEAFAAIDYGMADAVGSSATCLGVIGVRSDIMQRAKAVNEIKDSFKKLCAPLRQVRVRVPVKDEATPTRHISAMRVILRNIQRSDLNLLAAYRKIPVLQAPPESITYTRAMTRAVYRKSIEEIFTLLLTKEGAAASADRALLETLNPRETHLALVKERYKNVRANVVFHGLDTRGRGRVQIAAELPILFVQGRRDPPLVAFPPPETNEPPRRARESKLLEKRFLQTLPVFRYA